MADSTKTPDVEDVEALDPGLNIEVHKLQNVKWNHSTFYNALILGICNFLAPGIWTAMNSLGAGGEEKPYLVNAANGLTFGLMVVVCLFSSVVVRSIGIKWTLITGTLGYAPYAASLYTNDRYGNQWFVYLGATLCGLSAGLFWMAEAAIALSYPEPYNQGRFLGFWLSFRLGGQVLGGAINLGLNANDSSAGAVSYKVYMVFIALQALGPFAGLLLNDPSQVERTDGLRVDLRVTKRPLDELREVLKLLMSRNFLLIIPLICGSVYLESTMFSYESLWFSVRARALGSFLSGIVAIGGGNVLGAWLDRKKLALRTRARGAFFAVVLYQIGMWTWATVLVTRFEKTQPTFDWVDPGFGSAFALYLFMVMGFQINYLFLYFIVGVIAKDEEEVMRIAGLLRGTESAAQAVSYGLNSITILAEVGSVYLNFGSYALAVLPAWFVVREFGGKLNSERLARKPEEDKVYDGADSDSKSEEIPDV